MTTQQIDRGNSTTSQDNNLRSGLSSSRAVKGAVLVVAESNVTLFGEQTIDGVALVEADRVLLTAQTDATENGVYLVMAADWVRAADFNRNDDVVEGTVVWVNRGSRIGFWSVMNEGTVTFGTTEISFDFTPVTVSQGAAEAAADAAEASAAEAAASAASIVGDAAAAAASAAAADASADAAAASEAGVAADAAAAAASAAAAATSATTASTAATNAGNSATAAAADAAAADADATQVAADKATVAADKATVAADKAAAAASATAAATSATTATTQAGLAATSATAADASADAAALDAATATTKAAEASTSASNAATDAADADTARIAAEAARDDAEAAAGSMTPVEDQVVAAVAKATPADADLIGTVETTGPVLKKTTFSELATWFGTKLGPVIAAITGKTTPIGADMIVIADSAAANASKMVTFTNFWANTVGVLIAALTQKSTLVAADKVAIADSAASNATKYATITNLVWTPFGGLLAAGTQKSTLVASDKIPLADAGASNATKFATMTNVSTFFKGLGGLTLSIGDILYASGSDTLGRLAKGTDGQVLTLASGVPSWAAAAGGASTLCTFYPADNEPPSSNYAVYGTRNGHPYLAFDTTTQWTAIFTGVLPRSYAGTGLTVYVHVMMASATTGTVGFDVAIERIEASSLDLDADSFASAQTITATTVPGTSGMILTLSVAITSGANMDSLAAGEAFRLRLRRDVANDSATGDAQVVAVEVKAT